MGTDETGVPRMQTHSFGATTNTKIN